MQVVRRRLLARIELQVSAYLCFGHFIGQRYGGFYTKDQAREIVAYAKVRGITVTEVDIMPGVYAYASGRLIAFNRLYTPSVDVFNALMASDIGAGFHPALGRCTPAEFLAYHESAHIIDRTRELAPRIAMAVRYGERSDLDLSGYSFRGGVLNLGEALAEAFAATLCGSANPTEREIYTLFTEDL